MANLSKKVHIIDPFLYGLLSEWCLTKKREESIVVESIVASHLSRRRKAFYWRNRGEVDVIVKEDEVLKGFEVSWVEKPSLVKGLWANLNK